MLNKVLIYLFFKDQFTFMGLFQVTNQTLKALEATIQTTAEVIRQNLLENVAIKLD